MSPQPPSLSRVFVAERDPSQEVAFARGGKRSLADLRHAVAACAARIAEVGGGRWLLHTDDSFAACVGFFAIAHAGGVAVLPPNRQPDTLRQLAADCVGALLEPAADAPTGLTVLDPLGASAAALPELGELDPTVVVAELLTSGTTGDGSRITKQLSHLEDEIATLEAAFGAAVAGTRVFATVSHQHIYGLLFRVLWPLATGRPFCADTPLHAQELLPRMQEAGASTLVTTPVHLKRLVGSASLQEARSVLRAVFSSGGPLEAHTALSLVDALGFAPREILGSTETGGVAVRQRGIGDDGTWHALPGVQVEAIGDESRLAVTSPFVSCGDPAPGGLMRFTMGDRIALEPDGRFQLLGRADRTVKVGEKRLALPEMEGALVEHPDVDEAALFVAPRAGESRVHAVIVVSPRGRTALADAGRRGLGGRLAEHLAARWDRVLLPRAWRFVEALPRDAQGKLPTRALAALFDPGIPAPRVDAEELQGDRIVQELFIPVDLPGIEGHFESFPVVPGVMQIGWALAAAERILGEPPRVRRLDGVKFPAVLRPDSKVRLEVELLDERTRLRFVLTAEDETTATGRCRLGEATSP